MTVENYLVNWYLLQNIDEGPQQSLAFILNAMLSTKGFHQRSYFPVVVSRHGGEKAAEWNEGVIVRISFHHPWFPLFKTFPCPPPGGDQRVSWDGVMWEHMTVLTFQWPLLFPLSPHNHTHWCSIWKFKCPVNQSLNKDCFTLHVAWSWEEERPKKYMIQLRLFCRSDGWTSIMVTPHPRPAPCLA